MSTGKVFILRELKPNKHAPISLDTLSDLANRLDGTIIHLPIKYDLDSMELEDMLKLRDTLDKEITRRKVLDKLEIST
jgi:hypothetical protein